MMIKTETKRILISVFALNLLLVIFSACPVKQPAAKGDQKTEKKASPEKTYQLMTEAEQNKFVAEAADRVLQKLGFEKSEKVNGKGLELVKPYVNSYANRLETPAGEACRFGDNLKNLFDRGQNIAGIINQEFKAEEVPAEIGIYLAMIESEFCACLQSPTGPLGIFQFTRSNGEKYGLKIKQGASPTNPDERCEPKPASRAAARYIKTLAGEIDEGALKYAFAISNYNIGRIGSNTEKSKQELAKTPNSQESFWKFLTETGTEETKKYLPKFIGAAIVGENPKIFGVEYSPLSQLK